MARMTLKTIPVKAPVTSLIALHAKLLNVGHPCWRTILLSEKMNLEDLGNLLIAAFGWEGYHTNMFETENGWALGSDALIHDYPLHDGLRELEGVATSAIKELLAAKRPPQGLPMPGPDTPPMREVHQSDVLIEDILPVDGATALWTYDLGDCWEVQLTRKPVTPTMQKRANAHRPNVKSKFLTVTRPSMFILAGGNGGTPPEDSGGPFGYQSSLEILANPKDPGYAETLDWFESAASLPWGKDGYDPILLQHILDVHQGVPVYADKLYRGIKDKDLRQDVGWLFED